MITVYFNKFSNNEALRKGGWIMKSLKRKSGTVKLP